MASRPTARDVARKAGVSLATVSLVLNGRTGVGDGTRQRVLEAAAHLGYRLPDRAHRRAIGVLVERLPVPAYNDPAVGLMIHGIESEAGRYGYPMVLSSVDPGTGQLPSLVTERQVSGLIVVGGGDLSDDYIRALLATHLPVVLLDNFVDGLAVPCVLGDNETGGYLITRHLLGLGHRRIALLEGPRKYKTLTERREGYLRALDEAGVGPAPELMIKPLHASPRKGYREVEALLALPQERWPTAIFAVSDKTALGALDALKDAGVRVPDEIALVGFDDIAESAHVTPALTTVRLPMETMGQVALRRLAGLIDGSDVLPSKIVLYTEVVVRASSNARRQVATA